MVELRKQCERKGAAMANVEMISAMVIGVVVALAAPVLIWALVVTGVRQVTKKNSRGARQNDVQASKAEA
jgi:hypothetical protein